ncbi:cupin [Prolixibacter bellariivorans]|uniref:Cupin n=1 Tax=Prolixibacter bellariivorans TaxID=314319 RepID=A0A5M4B3A1_9BACT|nr:cupin domain-containing protein [Prolixibacter bellariivorans]GET34398.1 cupin [Prolixibacter bellariivorans]
MEKGKQFNVASGIEYAEGAVVSKTIIKESTGTITLFAFDKGQELSPHTAPFDALVQMMEGKATITVGGERAEMESGEAIILPANITHAVEATESFKMLLTMIKTNL